MDGYARNGVVANGSSVRDRMRARARQQSPSERGPFLTPEWLDHSFVLPVNGPAEVTVPSPRTAGPAPVPVFERPPTPEVDFAAVVRRSDAGRRARIATAAGLTLALVAVIVFQITAQPAAAACAILAAVVTFAAACVRIVVNRAPVPYLEA